MLKSWLPAIFLFSSFFAFGENLQIITSNGLQGVADEAGQVIIPAVYEKLGWSDGSNHIVNESIGYFEFGSWGLINISSKKLTSPKYSVLKPFGEDLYEVGITGKYSNRIFKGLIDKKSKVYLDLRFYTIDDVGDHRIIVSEYVDGDLKYGLYSDQNEVIIPLEFNNLERLGNLLIARNDQNKIHIYDINGSLLLYPWIDHIDRLDSNFIVSDDGYFGLLDPNGHKIYDLKYKSISKSGVKHFSTWTVRKIGSKPSEELLCDSINYSSDSQLLVAHVNNAQHVLAASEVLFQDQQHTLKHISNGYIITMDNASLLWGIYKTDGREIVSGFDSIAVDDHYFYARSGKKWDIYNLFGRKINEHSYDNVASSQTHNIPVKKGEHWGWVDFQGQEIVQCQYDRVIQTAVENLFIAERFGKVGISDFNGDWYVMPRYDSISFHQGFFFAHKGGAMHVFGPQNGLLHVLAYNINFDEVIKVEDDGQFGLITKTGFLVEPMYDHVGIVDGYYLLISDKQATLINEWGEGIFDESVSLENVLSFASDYFHVIIDGKHGFIDMQGNIRIANRYDSAQYFNEDLAPVKLRGKWGYIGPYENLVIQPFYQCSSVFENGLAIVQSDDSFGIINTEGKEIVQIKWKLIQRLETGNYKVTDWDGKIGLVGKSGRFIVRPNFSSLEDSDNDLIIVANGAKHGVIDYQGLTKIPFEYSAIKICGDYLLMQKEPIDQ